MSLQEFIFAIITRTLFFLVSLIGVWRVTWVKNNDMYWLLTILFVPLVIETIINVIKRKGKGHKWCSPVILLFLISIIPSLWILELHHQDYKHSYPQCKKLDSWENVRDVVSLFNGTDHNQTLKSIEKLLSSVCPNDWILALHQILLIVLIICKWLLPLGDDVSREQLSQLLLIFVSTAADILEFTSETLSDVKDNSPDLVFVILAVWTWSMLQFAPHLAVVNSGQQYQGGCCKVLIPSTEIWTIVVSLFIQDGPFLVVRLVVMTHFGVFHQMLAFFAIKNFLVVVLNLYRLIVICQEYRHPLSSASSPL